jgi:ferredoxin-NADP reductase
MATLGASSGTTVTDRQPEQTSGPGQWRPATVVSVRPETATAKTFRFRLDSPSAHVAGQHYIIRLTAPNGYTASRSYSIASFADDSTDFELTIERLPEGEVSTFMHDVAAPGDEIDVRGPIGGWFIWHGDTPALLVGGGSGVVPLMAMLRLARRNGTPDRVRLVVSVRTPDDLYYANELPGPEATVIYTSEAPPGSTRPPTLISPADIPHLPDGGLAYVCGSERFAEAAADLILGSGVAPDRLRIEKFGATG